MKKQKNDESEFTLTAFDKDGVQIGDNFYPENEELALKDAHDLLYSDNNIKKVVIEKDGEQLCAVN